MPTALQRGTSIADAGNFSEIGTVTNGACTSGTCIKNPLTGAYFANNTIPSNLINPVGYNILSYYPAPNTSVTAYGSPNFFGVNTLGDRADEFVGKLDHQFSSRLASEVYYMHYGSKEPGGNSLESLPGSSSSYLLYRKVDALGVQNTFTLNPTTVITAGFGFNRFPNNTLDISTGFNQAKLGFPSAYLSALSKSGFPQITTDSGLSPEGTSNSGPAVYFSRNFVTGISKSLGKHSIKAGYVFRAISLSFTSLSTTDGTFAFDSTLSGATAADLLLGYPTSGSLIIPAKLAITTQYNAFYVQDDWRITPRLTLNLGARYEHEPGVHERSNHYSVGFDRSATYTAGMNAAGTAVSATGGVEFAGQSGYRTSTGNTVNKYSPRIGFAYSVDPKTVVRGGFGVFYQPLVYSNSASYAPGYVLTNSIPSQSGVPTISLSDPYPGSTLSTTPTGNARGLSTSIGSTLTVIDQNRKAPLYESYSADVQRDLPYGIALKIGYVGGHGRNQPDALNINQLADANYSLGAQLDTKVANPYAGIGFWSNGKQSYNQTIRPFPQFQTVTDSESVGYSNYNALDIKVQKRLNQGVSVLAAFTWSSNWDNLWGASDTLNPGNNGPQDIYNLKPEYSRAINDIPKRTTFAVTYELPFGHGKTFLGGSNRWLDLAVGGWKVNDIMIIQDGGPLPITQVSSISVTTTSGNPPVSSTTKVTTSNAAYGNSTLRPTLVPGVSACRSGAPEGRLGGTGATPYFNAAAFTPTLSKSYGNSPRTVGCYGPGYLNTDLSLNKNFKLTERLNAEFRAEALNAFNTPEFNGPNLSVGSSSAGQITGTLGFPRLIQLGGRLTF